MAKITQKEMDDAGVYRYMVCTDGEVTDVLEGSDIAQFDSIVDLKERIEEKFAESGETDTVLVYKLYQVAKRTKIEIFDVD